MWVCCAWARVSAAPRHCWVGCWGLCLFVCALLLYPAIAAWAVRCRCVCLGLGFGCALPFLAGVLGCVCVRVRAPLVPCQSLPGCAVWVYLLGLGFRLPPATPGWGFGVCVCLCARSSCTPSILAGVSGMGLCSWARVSAAPRYSWLGCWDVCVCLCARSACTPPILAGVRVACVCAWARVSAAPRHSSLGSWVVCVGAPPLPGPHHSCLGCWGVCVFMCALLLYSANPVWAVRCGLCACARVSPAPRHCWLGYWAMCVFVCALRLYPANPGCNVQCGCVCWGSSFTCAPPILAGVLGSVCVCVRAPLVPRQSWLGCAVWVRVLGLGSLLHRATPGRVLGCVCVFVCALLLYPANPGWGERSGCVCLGSNGGCVPSLLAGVLGCVCVCVGALLVPRQSWLGCAVWVCVLGVGFGLRPATPGWGVGLGVAWHLFLCCALVRVVRAARARGTWSVCLGCGPRRASLACLVAPRWWAVPGPVRSLSVLSWALLTPWCLSPPRGLAPPHLLGGRPRTGLSVPAEAAALGSSRVVPVRGPAMGLSVAGPSGVGHGLRALR